MQKGAFVLGLVLLSWLGKAEADSSSVPATKKAPQATKATAARAPETQAHRKGASQPTRSPQPIVPRTTPGALTSATTRSVLPGIAPAPSPVLLQPKRGQHLHERALPLLVGWNDEMDSGTAWQQLTTANPVDVFASRPGLLSLRLPHVPQKYPYSYQWSGLQREVTVDLARYPVAVARISRMQENSYAQLSIAEYDYAGHEVKSWISLGLTSPGLAIVDIGKEWGVADTRRFKLRLIVGGALQGASCEYDWVRFVNREDVPFLQAHHDWQKVELRP